MILQDEQRRKIAAWAREKATVAIDERGDVTYPNKKIVASLERVRRPLANPQADSLIRASLQLEPGTVLKDFHARRAALCALLTPLRQNVGSCFATAPAILIQQELPLHLLRDIFELLTKGRLTRVIEGEEYSVPLSHSWGAGDLLRPITIAELGSTPLQTLAQEPGLIAAFERVGESCSTLLKQARLRLQEKEPFERITADEIIDAALVKHPQTRKDQAKEAFKAQTECALLKAWEFTLASLSESKADFAKWNLYASLGVKPEEPNGIGSVIYATLEEMLLEMRSLLEETQGNHDHLFAQVKYMEGRLRRASSDTEAAWLRADYQMRMQELNLAASLHHETNDKAQKVSKLLQVLLNFYGEKFKDYFQEVYDAQMHDVTTSAFDDSPAGFRLVYKHGRANPSLWTEIFDADEYIQSLSAFFIATETEACNLPETEGLSKEISDLISKIILKVKEPAFLESSFDRLARTYREPLIVKPLDNLDQVKRKPWSYVSGGTMQTMVSCYFKQSELPKTVGRWVENPTELLVFLLDTLKELPYSTQRLFEENKERSMLAFSPTHAFLCKPGWEPFYRGWHNDIFTYTWVRDNWIRPGQDFLETCLLDARRIHFLVQKLVASFPSGYRQVAKHALRQLPSSLTPQRFREQVMEILGYERWIKGNAGLLASSIDALLYTHLPLYTELEMQERLKALGVEKIPDFGRYKLFSAAELFKLASENQDPKETLRAMQNLGYAYPKPILFADTNWVNNYFGFVVNPGTGKLDLWRFNFLGSEGRPMREWSRYLDGSERKEWGLYVNPTQYSLPE